MNSDFQLCDILKNPEWWNVAATIFAACVAARITYVFGKRQTKLMERQTKQQEYEVYRKLYTMVKEADWLISEFYHLVHATMSVLPTEEDIISRLEDEQKRIIKIERMMQQHIVDFELKLPQGDVMVREYSYVLAQMSNIISFIRLAARNTEGIYLGETELEKQHRPSVLMKNEPLLQADIVARISNETNANRLEWHMSNLNESRDALLSKKFIESIKNRGKID